MARPPNNHLRGTKKIRPASRNDPLDPTILKLQAGESSWAAQFRANTVGAPQRASALWQGMPTPPRTMRPGREDGCLQAQSSGPPRSTTGSRSGSRTRPREAALLQVGFPPGLVAVQVEAMRMDWNWISIFMKMYIFGLRPYRSRGCSRALMWQWVPRFGKLRPADAPLRYLSDPSEHLPVLVGQCEESAKSAHVCAKSAPSAPSFLRALSFGTLRTPGSARRSRASTSAWSASASSSQARGEKGSRGSSSSSSDRPSTEASAASCCLRPGAPRKASLRVGCKASLFGGARRACLPLCGNHHCRQVPARPQPRVSWRRRAEDKTAGISIRLAEACSFRSGFEAGAGIAIGVGFVLKLMACAMQQPGPHSGKPLPFDSTWPARKLIGERLGANLTIRAQASFRLTGSRRRRDVTSNIMSLASVRGGMCQGRDQHPDDSGHRGPSRAMADLVWPFPFAGSATHTGTEHRQGGALPCSRCSCSPCWP